MSARDFPSEREQPSAGLQGVLAQVGQPWWGFIIGLIVGVITFVGSLTFFWLSWFTV
jgi:hypothetical protein